MDIILLFHDPVRCILIGQADGFYWFTTDERFVKNPRHDKWAGAQGAFFVA